MTRFTSLPVTISLPVGAVTFIETVAARAGIVGQASAREIAIPATDWIILRNILILLRSILIGWASRQNGCRYSEIESFVCNDKKPRPCSISFFQAGGFLIGYPQLSTGKNTFNNRVQLFYTNVNKPLSTNPIRLALLFQTHSQSSSRCNST